MQKQALRWRAEWVWLVVLLLPVLLGFWWVPGERAGPNDTFSYGSSGKSAIYSLAEDFLGARRSDRGLPPFSDDFNVDTLCILGPSRYPDSGEWNRLQEWVWRGHNLVFAAKHNDPAVEIDTFALKIVPDDSAGLESSGDEDDKPSPDDSETEKSLLTGTGGWRSRGAIEVEEDLVDILIAKDGKPQAVSFQWGEGQMVVLSSDYVFTNYAVAREDNGLLAYRILELAHTPGATMAFDEFLNASGPPKVVGLLLDPLFRPLTLQLILCCVVFGWMGSRRFGPTVSSREGSRRSIVEHAKALGNLHFKAGTGSRCVSTYLDYFRHELRLNYLSPRVNESVTAMARQAKWDEKEVMELLRRAERIVSEEKTSASRAASVVRSLAKLKHALEDSKGD